MPPQWILVADDDPLIRELWVEALTRAGYRTLPAKSGHEAIELMRVVVPDLAILDLRMPGLTGGEVLEYLHDSPVLRRIPVLIVSGFLEDEPSPATTGLTIVGRLAKPLSLAALLEAVRTALERRKPLDPAAVPLNGYQSVRAVTTLTDGAPGTHRPQTSARRPGESST